VIRFIDEHPGTGRLGRLGRHVEHDPRSRAFPISEDLFPRTYTSALHKVDIPVLDQGHLGSCTGNAAEALVGSDPLYVAVPMDNPARPTGDALADEAQAVALYSAATHRDGIHGQYPPLDTGSTGLAVAKAAASLGLISGYQHAFSLDATLRALSVSPLIVGVHWYEGFDHPDATGLVTVGGDVRGGHEFLLFGIDTERRTVQARNSWGPAFGVEGCFTFSWDDLGRLLDEQGDATLFVPLGSPAPTPSGQSVPDAVDAALVAAFEVWRQARGV
jgi:hypothetical protein